MKIVRALLFVSMAAGLGAATPTWDTSGNGMLNGTYYFRHVIYQLSAAADGSMDGSLYDAVSFYGTATFSGTGTYSVSATLVDGRTGQVQSGTVSGGTYSIAASGYGFISNLIPTFSGDAIHGMVNAQGIFVGSSTENQNGYNDVFIAAPIGSPAPTAASFKGTYTFAYLDLSTGDPAQTIGATLRMSPDGNGNISNVSVTGYIAQNGSNKTVQSISNVKYRFSNGAAVLTFPNSQTAFLSGDYYLYFSPDGNFVFGGGPYNSLYSPFDLLVGVRTGSGTPDLSGLYYEAGIDQDVSTLASGYARLDGLYGAFSANSGTILGHQRLADFFNSSTIDYSYSDTYSVSNGTYSSATATYAVANGIRIGSGIGPYLGISVALQAPTMSSTLSATGVFLNPQGVVNAGSSAPFTAGVAPGELLTLYGENLASGTQVAASAPFPTTLGKVQVYINDIPAPIYYVTRGQLSVIVPYGVTGNIASVQVFNNNVPSNAVTSWISTTAPGVLTQSQNGLGYGDVLHLDGTLVDAKHPAKIGETVSVYLTGLGAVSPVVNDGAAGPVNPFAETPADTIAAYIGNAKATIGYSGLAPGLAGLYQINVTVPSDATAGTHFLDIAGPDSYVSVCWIEIAAASAATSTSTAAAVPAHRPVRQMMAGRSAKALKRR